MDEGADSLEPAAVGAPAVAEAAIAVDEVAASILSAARMTPSGNEEAEEAPIASLINEIHPADEAAEVVKEVVGQAQGDADSMDAHLTFKSSFEELGLPPSLLKGVYGMKYNKPSRIQGETIPHIMEGRSVLGQAQTGSGKTACFALGMLYRLDSSIQKTQGLCLAPTRELVHQLHTACKTLGAYVPGVTFTLCIPDMSKTPVEGHLVFGTPGKVDDSIRRKKLKMDSLRTFVIDEVDSMVNIGNLADKTKRIAKYVPPDAQVLLFSATYESGKVKELARRLTGERPTVDVLVKREELSLDGIRQFVVYCNSPEAKFGYLDDIFGCLTIGQTIIFVKKRTDADDLHRDLVNKKHSVASLHGNKTPKERDQIMNDFRDGKTKVLISTNVLARGIDILQVTLTVNYDLPTDQEGKADPSTYLHRSGRTARFGRKGVTLNMVDGQESRKVLDTIEKSWNKKCEELNEDNMESKLGDALKAL